MTSTRKLYTIPVIWKMYGDILVEANSLEEAIDLVNDKALPPGEYLSDSFEIDYDEIKQIEKEAKRIVRGEK